MAPAHTPSTVPPSTEPATAPPSVTPIADVWKNRKALAGKTVTVQGKHPDWTVTHTSRTDGTPILFHDLFTNGIVYLDLGFDLHALPQELLPYAGLFGRLLTRMGTEREDFVQLTQRIGRETGGIRAATLTSSVIDSDRAVAYLCVRGKATASQSAALLDILRDILLTVRLDQREQVWIRRHIPATLALLGTQRAMDALVTSLDDPDGFLRYKSIVAIEQLRACIRAPKAGKAGREQIRAAIAPICEEAKRSAAMPEQLLVSLKELCNSLPEYGRMRGASERGAFLDTVVSLAIEEFYRS